MGSAFGPPPAPLPPGPPFPPQPPSFFFWFVRGAGGPLGGPPGLAAGCGVGLWPAGRGRFRLAFASSAVRRGSSRPRSSRPALLLGSVFLQRPGGGCRRARPVLAKKYAPRLWCRPASGLSRLRGGRLPAAPGPATLAASPRRLWAARAATGPCLTNTAPRYSRRQLPPLRTNPGAGGGVAGLRPVGAGGRAPPAAKKENICALLGRLAYIGIRQREPCGTPPPPADSIAPNEQRKST